MPKVPATGRTPTCKVCGSLDRKIIASQPKNSKAKRKPVTGDAAIPTMIKNQTWLSCQFCAVLRACMQKYVPEGHNQATRIIASNRVSRNTEHQPHEIIDNIILNFQNENGDNICDIELFSLEGETPAWEGLGCLKLPATLHDQIVQKVGDLLATCQLSHEKCKQFDPVDLPKRVIDVRSIAPDVRLFETDGLQGKYLTLSYCWGTTKPLMTETNSLEDRKNRINFQDLTPTFRDVVTLTRDLGFDYVWIDSLCIIQDSIEDWEIESAKMASVYANAYLTVKAGVGSGCGDHFLTSREQALTIPLEIDGNHRNVYAIPTVGGVTYPTGAMTTATVASRGWVTQERALSKRYAMFTRMGVFWECGNGIVQETHPNADRKYTHSLDMSEVTSENATKYWRHLVNEYSRRKLSYVTDKLPAIAGMAHRVQELTGYVYQAGLWKEEAILDLAWNPTMWDEVLDDWHPESDRSTMTDPYTAPSWSWASINGFIVYRSVDSVTVPMATVHEVSTSRVSDLLPLGRVQAGYIEIEGPTLEIRIDVEDTIYNTLTGRIDSQGTCEIWPDTALNVVEVADEKDGIQYTVIRGNKPILEPWPNVRATCLFLSKTDEGIQTLILGRSPTVAGSYERVGFTIIRKEDPIFNGWTGMTVNQKIRII